MMSQILSTSNFEDQYVTFKLGTDLVAVKLTEIETIKQVIVMLDGEIKQLRMMSWVNIALILGVLILVITTL